MNLKLVYIAMCLFLFLGINIVFADVEASKNPNLNTNIPAEMQTQTLSTIQQEHKQTRTFFSQELTRQREQFYKDIDSRGEYYEREVDSMLNSAVWKLGLLWGGIVFFIVGVNTFLTRRLDKKRFTLLKDAVLKEANKDYKTDNSKLFDKMKKDEQKAKEVFNKQLNDIQSMVIGVDASNTDVSYSKTNIKV